MNLSKDFVHAFLITVSLAVGFVLVGCDRKETILDVDTPDGGVEVERNIDDGSIIVDVDE